MIMTFLAWNWEETSKCGLISQKVTLYLLALFIKAALATSSLHPGLSAVLRSKINASFWKGTK